jgi:predicted secreted protein
MKNLSILMATLVVAFSFTNCSEKKAESLADFASVDSTAADVPADAGMHLSPEERKFIRRAELRFKVKNVQASSNVVEDLVGKYKGFIVKSQLSTNVLNINEVELSEDSVLRNKSYEVNNEISLRIPNESFEKLQRDIQPLMTFLDGQTVSAEDVSLNLMASELRKKRYSRFEKRYEKTIDSKGKKLMETSTAEENLLNHQSEADNNQIKTLRTKDEVNYSTITLHLYQPITVMQEMLPNIENTHAFKPNLFIRIWQSVREGWYILEEIIVFFARLWFLILLAFGAFWLYKRRVKVNV